MSRNQILGLSAASVMALLIGQGIAKAQAPSFGPPAPPPPADASFGLARQVSASPQDQLAETDAHLNRIEAARASIRRLLETARAQRDILKTLCLNDKLNQMDVALRSARERRQSLEAAARRGDADLANHEYTILTVLRQRAEQISAEANLCIGKEAEIVETENAISTDIDPGLPQEDPSEYPHQPVILEPATCTSCTK